MKTTVKYPRALAKTEITPRRQLLGTTLMDAERKLLDQRIEDLAKGMFELAGIYPYIFDALCFVCTHMKDTIERVDVATESHYRIKIPIGQLYDMALDGEYDQKHHLLRELLVLHRQPQIKAMWLRERYTISCAPIRVELVYKEGRRRTRNLKNTTMEGREISFVIIEFFKPLFLTILMSDSGKAWFLSPKALHAKMIRTIRECRNSPTYDQYGHFLSAASYRRLFLFMNLHDNKQGGYLNFKALDLCMQCMPQNICVREDREYLKSHHRLQQFITQGVLLFLTMSQNGLMGGMNFIPIGTWYNKGDMTIRVTFNRSMQSSIPSAVGDLPPRSERSASQVGTTCLPDENEVSPRLERRKAHKPGFLRGRSKSSKTSNRMRVRRVSPAHPSHDLISYKEVVQ